MKSIDARGYACPKPVLMAREAVMAGEIQFEVIVDNEVSASNVTRFLGNQGYDVVRDAASSEKNIVLTVKSSGAKPETVASKNPIGDYAVLMLSQHIGSDSQELGEVLMKSFLGTLLQRDELPSAIALMNGGVKLALPESSASDTLRDLESHGVVVLVCGTCTTHYGITEKITVGQISNMFEITETIFGAKKPIVIG